MVSNMAAPEALERDARVSRPSHRSSSDCFSRTQKFRLLPIFFPAPRLNGPESVEIFSALQMETPECLGEADQPGVGNGIAGDRNDLL